MKSGGNIKDVLKKYEQKDREDPTPRPNQKKPLKPKEEITITWKDKKENGFELKKTCEPIDYITKYTGGSSAKGNEHIWLLKL